MKILIYVDNLERLKFFLKITVHINNDIIFMTNKFSIYIKINKKYKTYLVKHSKDKLNYSEIIPDNLSTLAGYQNKTQATLIFNDLYLYLDNLYKKEMFNEVFIWNGGTTFAYTLKEFCKEKSIKTLFFEISNFHRKIFVDINGVNARSYLYNHIEILDSMEIDENKFNSWLEEYKSNKSKLLKQAKNKSLIRIEMLIDYFGYFFFSVIREDFRNPLIVIKDKLLNKFNIVYNKVNLNSSYIFFPMQVSNDSQVILNSDFDNIDVIKELINKYSNENIYIKIHPAEPNRRFIKKVLEFEKRYNNIKIVGNDTKDLIVNAKKVVVINSTVGLESLLYEKNLEVYGRAFYSNFNRHRLIAYIQKYLINIDYFDNEEVSKKEIQRILDK